MLDIVLAFLLAGSSFLLGTAVYQDRIKAKNKGSRLSYLLSGKSLEKKNKYLKEEKQVLEEAIFDNKLSTAGLKNGIMLEKMKDKIKSLKEDSKTCIIVALVCALIAVPIVLNYPFFLSGSTVILRVLGMDAILIPPAVSLASLIHFISERIDIASTKKAIKEYERKLKSSKIEKEEPVPTFVQKEEKTRKPVVNKTPVKNSTVNEDILLMNEEELKFEIDLAVSVDQMLRAQYKNTTDAKTKQLLSKRIVANYYRHGELTKRLEEIKKENSISLTRKINNR